LPDCSHSCLDAILKLVFCFFLNRPPMLFLSTFKNFHKKSRFSCRCVVVLNGGSRFLASLPGSLLCVRLVVVHSFFFLCFVPECSPEIIAY
jgi:hypothetical protein